VSRAARDGVALPRRRARTAATRYVRRAAFSSRFGTRSTIT
jgi:hypothetical protein